MYTIVGRFWFNIMTSSMYTIERRFWFNIMTCSMYTIERRFWFNIMTSCMYTIGVRFWFDFWLVGFVALRPKSTAMVIAGRSVHLTTLFPGQA